MLKLKPLGEPQGRSIVQISNLLPSLRVQVYHPHTCTHVRLLGPCFKTGRLEPFRQPQPRQSHHPPRLDERTSKLFRPPHPGFKRVWPTRLTSRSTRVLSTGPHRSRLPAGVFPQHHTRLTRNYEKHRALPAHHARRRLP